MLFSKKGLNSSLVIFGFSVAWVILGLWLAAVLVVRSSVSADVMRDVKKSFIETKSVQNFYEYFATRPHILKITRLQPRENKVAVSERPLVKKGARSTHDFFSSDVSVGKDRFRIWYAPEFYALYAREKKGLLILMGFLWLVAGMLIVHLINSRMLFEPLSRLADGSCGLAHFKNKNSPFYDVAKVFEDLRSQLALYSRHSTMLLQAAKSISSQMEFNHAISMILDLVVEKFPGTSSCVVLMDDDGYLRVKNSRGLSADFIKKMRLRRGEGFVGECIESRKMVIVQDAMSDKNPVTAEIVAAENIRSFIHLPIMVENRAVGAFNINSSKKDYFTQDIISIAATLSEYLSIAISNSRLYERLRDFNKRLETEVSYTTSELLKTNAKLVRKIRMLRVAMDIFQTLESSDGGGEIPGISPPEVITRIFARIRDVINADFGALLVAESQKVKTSPSEEYVYRLVHRFAGFKEPENRFPQTESRYQLHKLFSSEIVSAISGENDGGKTLIRNALKKPDEARWGFVPKEVFIKNYMIVPVISRRFKMGLIVFGNKIGGEGFDDEDIEFMSLIAPRIGFYIYCKEFCVNKRMPSIN